MGHRLYVGNIGQEVSSTELEQLFSDHGTVDSVNMISDRTTGQSRGFGFVEMASNSEATAAMKALNGAQLDGREIKVSEAMPRRAAGGSERRRGR